MKNKTYSIRQNILKAMQEYDIPCKAEDVVDYPGFLFVKPTFEEIRSEWHKLRTSEFIEAYEGFEGEYCKITAKGLQQVNPEYKKDVFVWGPRALKAIVLFFCIFLLAGCTSTRTTFKYDLQGNVTERIDETRSMIGDVMDEMRVKNIARGVSGWFCRIRWTLSGSETFMPNIEFTIANLDKWHISLKDKNSSDDIKDIVQEVMRKNVDVSVSPNGATLTENNDTASRD